MRMIGDQKNCLNFVAISKQPKRFDIFLVVLSFPLEDWLLHPLADVQTVKDD